jgi:hypothetical protein
MILADILITYNQPMATCEDESLYDTVLNDMSSILRQAISDDSEDYPVPAEPSSEQAIHSVYNIWWNALSTFTIVDQSIFCD